LRSTELTVFSLISSIDLSPFGTSIRTHDHQKATPS
jgi:hypothetical protein